MMDLDIERQVLACMIADKSCLESGIYDVNPDHFTQDFCHDIFYGIKKMYEEKKTVNPVTVATELKDIVKHNGTSWLLLKDGFYSTASFQYYIDRLQKLFISRQIVMVAQEAIHRLEDQEDPGEVAKSFEELTYKVSTGKADEIVTPKQLAERILNTVSERMDKRSNGGISTSYVRLNYALNGGYLPGQLIIFAAQTGKGKTAFAMNQMRDIAITQKIPSLYVNTEMGAEQMDIRNAAILSVGESFTHTDLAAGKLSNEQFNRLAALLDKMHTSGFYTVTVPDLTINTLISTARRFKAQTGMKFMIVDYVGRMDTADAKLTEWQVYKTIAKKLKTLAQQLEITIIMLAQVNDDEKLEGARGMKNECDLFGLLREMTFEEMQECQSRFNYYLVLDKNRDGGRGKVPLKFIGERMTFKGETADEVARSKQKSGTDIEATARTGTVVNIGYSGTHKRKRMPYDD
ncbi:MAG: Replicative helicase (DnaB) [Firmicutes bacterium]|nr:Replicative helicase (DnaB) [Bacillota bacterium]